MPSPSDNVWIGDLPVGMDKGSLATLFEPYGTVMECRVMPGRDENAKPCAMVRFGSVDMATWVVENINGNIPEGLSEPVQIRFANDNHGAGKGKDKGGGVRFDPYGAQKGGGKPGALTPSDNVWVGDLPVGTAQTDLATIFEQYGQIVNSKMLPGRDAAAKPCAMIRFASVDMATWVVESLNGNIPQGLDAPIIARFANSSGGGKADNSAGWGGGAQAQQDNSGWGGKGGKKGAVPSSPSDNVWVGDLPVGAAQTDLATIFEPYGQIVNSRMLPGRDPAAKPCAMIRFASVDMATWVVENLNGNIPQGLDAAIIVRFANSSGGGQADNSGGKGGGPQAWQQDNSGWSGKAAGKNGGAAKGKNGGAPGSFQALFQSVKGGGVLGGGTVPQESQVFVKNLPPDTTDEGLYKLFSPFGAIPPGGVKAMMNADGTCKGIGFIDFSEPSAAQTAVLALEGFEGISVSQKKPSKGGGKGKSKDGGKDAGKGGSGKWGGGEDAGDASAGW